MPAMTHRWSAITVATLVDCLLWGWLSPACTRITATPPATDEEQRLLPEIIRQQEARVQEASRSADAAHDAARSLRLRQRMLREHGREDLALALEQDALAKEA